MILDPVIFLIRQCRKLSQKRVFYIITLIAGIARLDQGSGCEPEIPDSECDSRMLIGTKHSQSVLMA